MTVRGLNVPKDKGSYPQYELHQLQLYRVKADPITCTCSTAMTNLFKVEEGTLIHGFIFQCTDDWASSASVPYSVILQLGDTTTANLYATLTMAELTNTDRSGFIAVDYESTGEGYITHTLDHGGVSSDAAEGSGGVSIWCVFSPESESQHWIVRNAGG